MPTAIQYVNFRATIPGEHKPHAVRNCMGYVFVGGKYEARMPINDARRAHAVVSTYFSAHTEHVPDVPVSEKDTSTGDVSGRKAKVPGKRNAKNGKSAKGAATDGGPDVAADDRGRDGGAEAGNGSESPDDEGTSEDQSEADTLV